jgi:hypothetical protein
MRRAGLRGAEAPVVRENRSSAHRDDVGASGPDAQTSRSRASAASGRFRASSTDPDRADRHELMVASECWPDDVQRVLQQGRRFVVSAGFSNNTRDKLLSVVATTGYLSPRPRCIASTCRSCDSGERIVALVDAMRARSCKGRGRVRVIFPRLPICLQALAEKRFGARRDRPSAAGPRQDRSG